MAIKLSVLPNHVKRDGLKSEGGRYDVLEALMSVLKGCVVVAPDMVGCNGGAGPGKFGVTELHPFPDLVDPVIEQLERLPGL